MFRRTLRNERQRTTVLSELVAARKALKMTQADVATAMETTQSAISDIESRANDPRLSTLQRYAAAVQRELQIRVVGLIEAIPPISMESPVEPDLLQRSCSPRTESMEYNEPVRFATVA